MKRLLISFIYILFLFHFAVSQENTVEEIFLETESGTLGGILSLPPDCKKCPAVLIIQGSGPTDKDGNSAILPGKNNSLKQLSESLNDIGIATLRYDKRGMGMSKNIKINESDLVFDDFVNDAKSFLNFLIDDKRFKKIGVAGHSQGSLVGMLISQDKKVKAFASIAGPSFSIDETLLAQLKANPYNPPKLLQEAEEITALLKQGIKVTEVSSLLQSIYRPSIQPFMMSWMKYDPSNEISKLKSNILIINGSTDLQVKIEDAQRLKASNDKAKLVIINGMNHVLKDASASPIENNATYSNPDLLLNAEFKSEVQSFFSKSLK